MFRRYSSSNEYSECHACSAQNNDPVSLAFELVERPCSR
jgi:hypothetical protein